MEAIAVQTQSDAKDQLYDIFCNGVDMLKPSCPLDVVNRKKYICLSTGDYDCEQCWESYKKHRTTADIWLRFYWRKICTQIAKATSYIRKRCTKFGGQIMIQLNDKEYIKLIEQDMEWLKKQLHSLEKTHILIILQTIVQQRLSAESN